MHDAAVTASTTTNTIQHCGHSSRQHLSKTIAGLAKTWQTQTQDLVFLTEAGAPISTQSPGQLGYVVTDTA
jgi:hypothetical protein